ncbi:MAG: hypothetical protein F6K31_17640 [Symploca sp. SIO2G7]|nr:hypothetical protein [Symploca sp. SIO2G7]
MTKCTGFQLVTIDSQQSTAHLATVNSSSGNSQLSSPSGEKNFFQRELPSAFFQQE